ncbi:N-acetyltransferase [Streptococcus sp. X16XC17]|uniref:GNAT family N-acetyltransferase n=1 Tax=unclassified Streptococcus TaxID=2608887 RepID=UPI00066FE43E|nr:MULTISPECIES: GNAT family N-acetyltransferase [unclassified Streptococcus]TCD46478.1 N-acetyltransferase [Streptococcus sp. X16XC17]
MNHKGTKKLETNRLILRKYESKDVEDMFHNWVNDSEVMKYLTWKAHGSIEVTREINLLDISKYDCLDYYKWVIILKSSKEAIGGINVAKVDESCSSVEVAYRLGKAWWNKGIASEALSRVIEFLFEEVGVNRIAAMHDTNNASSGLVMKKCGMSYEGTLRQAGLNNQGIYDIACYSILYDEYIKMLS